MFTGRVFFCGIFLLAALGGSIAKATDFFDFQNQSREERESVYWFPLLGLAIPGLPQFLNGQTGPGAVYLGVAAIGLGAAVSSYSSIENSSLGNDYSSYTDQEKLFDWGTQTYQDIGLLSVYHAFRTSALDRHNRSGDFDFLPQAQETSGTLFLSPFRLDYLRYPSVFIPLGLFAGGAILSHNIGSNGSPTFTWSDGFFTAATSYNAGVGEEAFFRGYLMMNFRESWGSDFWSLTASSVLFGAAHISSDNPYPWPQLIGGFYLGWLAQHDDWTLSRNVFVHAWWDIIAFISEFSSDTVHPKIMLPLVDARF